MEKNLLLERKRRKVKARRSDDILKNSFLKL